MYANPIFLCNEESEICVIPMTITHHNPRNEENPYNYHFAYDCIPAFSTNNHLA